MKWTHALIGLLVALFVVSAPPFDELYAEGRSAKAKRASRTKAKRSQRGGRQTRSKGVAEKVTYTVIPGDTLLKIAKRYGVTSGQIKRWNRLKNNTIVAGQKLVIRTRKTSIPRRGVKYHVVKRKETYKSIAKKHKVEVGDLISWNPQHDPRSLRVGDKIAMYFDRYDPVATHKKGRFNGVQMPKGRGYRVRNANRAWGTPELVRVLRDGIGKVKRRHGRKASNLVIGDLSTKRGGYLPPHKSHRSGRDADVAYYIKGTDTSWRFIRATPDTLDVARTWELFHTFL
ncbi:MAG: penicillin-insensitive murein endopeptidase, partial [Myxococcota bacterium]